MQMGTGGPMSANPGHAAFTGFSHLTSEAKELSGGESRGCKAELTVASQ